MRAPPGNAGSPAPSESDTNLSQERRAWAERNLDTAARALLAEDERYFLRQSVSTPCLNAIVKAEGIFIEDTAGRRMMDFHGNNVHHIGYGHPRLKRAIAEQMEALPFTPRRYTSEPAVALAKKLAEITPGKLGKVLFTTGGSDAVEVAIKLARAATGRYKTLVLLGRLPRRGLRRGGGRRRGAVPLRPRRPADAGRRTCRAVFQLPLPLWHVERRRILRRLRAHDRLCARAAKATSRR